MEIVNGVPCFNCTDVEKAKKAAAEPPPPEAPSPSCGHSKPPMRRWHRVNAEPR